MGIFDRFRHKGAHDKARDMSDAAERKADERTGGGYESQVDAARQQAERRTGMDRDDDQPGSQ